MIRIQKIIFVIWVIIFSTTIIDFQIDEVKGELQHEIELGVTAECKESVRARSPSTIQITVSFPGISSTESTAADAFWHWSQDEDEIPHLFHKRLSGKQLVIIPGAQIEFMRYCGEAAAKDAQVSLEMLNEMGKNFFHLKSVKNVNLPQAINRANIVVPWQKQKTTLGYDSANPYQLELKINVYTPQVIVGILQYRYDG
ncbi:MAG: hypothetical protein ABH859_03900 [Pseudomonadota bacterium]|nr:hypothetical protein [Candidatus Margulisiibacteriota bacterium]